jgi:hypothetical protein
MSRLNGLPGYDAWKTRSPEDQYAMDHPEKFRRGIYRVKVERTITAVVTVEIESYSEEDAIFDAIIDAKTIPLDKWNVDQDDYDTFGVECPSERDPDEEREDRRERS